MAKVIGFLGSSKLKYLRFQMGYVVSSSSHGNHASNDLVALVVKDGHTPSSFPLSIVPTKALVLRSKNDLADGVSIGG